MSSVDDSFSDKPRSDVSEWIHTQAAELRAELEGARPRPSLETLHAAIRRMSGWCERLATRSGVRTQKHFEGVLSQGIDDSQMATVVLQALDALPKLAEALRAQAHPDWISEELVESTLHVFQPRYTKLGAVLLTPQDAVDMICRTSELAEQS